MFPDVLDSAAPFPIMLAVLATLLATGAVLTFRSGPGRARPWRVTALLLAALISSWASRSLGEHEPGTVDPTVMVPTVSQSPAGARTVTSVPAGLDSARTECAEARDHFGRVMLLVRNLKNAEAGVEMLASADHLERALRDAGHQPDRRTGAVLREARASATRLIRNSGAVPVGIGVAIEALGTEVDRTASSLTIPRA